MDDRQELGIAQEPQGKVERVSSLSFNISYYDITRSAGKQRGTPASHFPSILVDEAVVNGVEGEFAPVPNAVRTSPGHSGLTLKWVNMPLKAVGVALSTDRHTGVNSA